MWRGPSSGGPQPDVLIRPMRADDLPAADVIRRLAFGTFLGLPDPMTFRGDADPIRPRFLADPDGGFAAEVDGTLVGTNVLVDWGSVGFFGPLSVHPDMWDRGIAGHLVAAALAEFARRGTRHIGLFTFGHSPKHVALYQKFGFWPRFPTAIMGKPVTVAAGQDTWSAFSDLSRAHQRERLTACRELGDTLYPGLNLSREIAATVRHRVGDVVLLHDADALAGFAVCQAGPDTEAGSDTCYVKFGAVWPGPRAAATFARLVASCEALAAERGSTRLMVGVNTARRRAYRHLLRAGFRTEVVGMSMDRPDEVGYNRASAYILDDWR